MIDKLKIIAAIIIVAAGVAGFYYLDDQSILIRSGVVIVAVIAGLAVALLSGPGQQAWAFSKDAKTEVKKVVWPTRRETFQATGIVLALVILVGIYLALVDKLLFWVIYDIVLGSSGA